MWKRIMIGLVAVGLVTIFNAEAANAAWSRWFRSIDNIHDCIGVNENCYGAVEVTDQLYGVSLEEGSEPVATCLMAGIVFCNPVNFVDCPVAADFAALGETDFLATMSFVGGSASNETALDPDVGQTICDDNFKPDGSTIFDKYWPDDGTPLGPDFVAHTTYYFSEGVPLEIKELCYKPSEPTNGYLRADCESFTGKLPCCGDPTTLTVGVTGGGRVTSDDGNINCVEGGENCEFDYGNEPPAYDTCPEITLTADVDDPHVTAVEWGGACADQEGNTCTVTPNANVTATFGVTEGYIRVVVDKGIVDGAKVWIKQPQKANFSYPEPKSKYCTGVCYINVSELPFKGDEDELIMKRAGGEYNTWIGFGGICVEGANNSLTTCTIDTDPLVIQEITAQWVQVAE